MNFNSDEQLIKYLLTQDNFDYNLILKFKNDDYKEQFIDRCNYYEKIAILNSIKNDVKRNIVAIKHNIYDDNDIIDLINASSFENIKKYIYAYKTNILINTLETNDINKYIQNINSVNIGTIDNISKDITFGVELESYTNKNTLLLSMDNILFNWKLVKENSIINGIEIVSPILHYKENDLKELKFICKYMEENNYNINPKCGGHIHIGLDYFKEVNELKMLYYLFINCEEIFYIILNRNNTIPRLGVNKYCLNISQNINIENLFNSNYYNQFINYLKEVQTNKYYDINIINAGNKVKNTIEFRMPNGEIDYEQLNLNIKLILKLIEKSKELAHLEENDIRISKLKEIGIDNDNYNKLNILLDLLEINKIDKKEYINRYINNSKLINQNINPLECMDFQKILYKEKLFK